MQAKQMSASLREFALLLEDEGRLSSARELELLANALSAGNDTVTKVVGKAKRHWKSSKRDFSFPETLQARLERIASFLAKSGAARAAKDYRALPSLGVGRTYCDVSIFCRELKAAIEAPLPAAKSRAKALEPEEIRALAERLTSASRNNDEFDATLAEVSGNKLIKTDDLAAIAKRFLGTDRTFKSKSEIIRAMRSRQLQDALQDSRERRLSKIAV